MPGLHPSPGGAASLSPFLNKRLGFPILAILALLAASLLFLLPGSPLQAQDSSIMYEENGTDPVATFTGSDPEGRPVYWSLLASDGTGTPGDITADTDSAEVAHFSISANGVLSFNFPPDYESPPTTNTAAPNTYRVVVVAADEPQGAANRVLGYKPVTVNVTNVDEPGVITLDAQQPQENRPLMAALIDDDALDTQKMAAKWKWEHSESKGGPWTAILTATSAAYTPLGVADKYLRATATYTDGHGSDKNAQEVTPHMVRAVPAANNANPVFPDEDTTTENTIDVDRKVDENSPPGTRVGDPVAANDAPGDVLTYTISGGANASSYRIDPATGQITVGPGIALDREASGGATHTVNVTATDPWGPSATPSGATEQIVTITINDVNEDPVITGGDTKASVDENTGITEGVGATYAAYPEASGTACTDTTCTWSLKGPDAGDFNIGNQTGGTLGQLTFKIAPNYEAPADANGDNVYMVTVMVTDAGIEGKGKLSAERDVVVTVTNLNEGTATSVVTLSSLVPKVGVPLTATLSDPDGGEKDVEWQWSIVGATDTTARPDGDISGAESATYTPKADDVGGTLTAMVEYADAVGSSRTGTAGSANAVVADQAAKAPVFKPKPASRSVPENYATGDTYGTEPEVTYPAVGAVVEATDANVDTLTYSLGGTDAGSFDINQETGQISVKTATKLDLEAKPTYMVTVTATDPGGLSDSVDVTIKLTDEDEGPEIAGDDISRDYPENGTGSVATLRATDPEGRRPVYWSLLATDGTGTPGDITADTDSAEVAHFSISANGVLSFNFPPDYESPPTTDTAAPNTYRVVVVAADEPQGAANRKLGYKKVTVNVTNVNETETVTLSLRQAQIGTPVTATYNDSDDERPADTGLMWKWYLGSSEITEGITATESTSSYTPISAGSHRAEASYTKADGSKKAASATISVRATPTNPQVAPLFSPGSDRRSVDENSPPGTRVGSAVTATDPGDMLTYTISGGANASSYRIDPATGQITVGPGIALDREASGGATHTVNVTATDPWGPSATPSGATEQIVTITINDVNEDPVITGGDTKASVDENTGITEGVGATYAAYPEASGTACTDTTCTWSLKGPDAGDFNIGNQTGGTLGQLTFKIAPNYEAPADANGDNVYMVTVMVTDAGIEGKGKLSAERDVVVTVTNLNEGTATSVVTLSSLVPKVGVPLTATLSDPDGGEKDVEWQWSIVGATDTTARPDGDISGAESATYTPKADDVGGTLTAMVEYADAVGSSRTGTAGSANAVVADQAAKAPVFKPKPASRSVPENYATGDTYGTEPEVTYPAVGAVVEATDANVDTLTYSLGGTDAGSFDINQETGQISVKTATKLDLEAKPTYMVTVTATDPGGLSDSVDVTIKLTDKDEGPEIERDPLTNQAPEFASATAVRSVGENTLAGQPIGARVQARDANGDELRYALSGTDSGTFDIDGATGQLMTRAPLDYETKASYSVTVTASDSGGLSDSIDVTITVTNVDEIGRVTFWRDEADATTAAIMVGDMLGGLAEDPDGNVGDTPPITDMYPNITGATWQWAKTMTPDMMDSWMDITGATDAAYMVMDADEGYHLRATAMYDDGEGMGKMASEETMMVMMMMMNAAPMFESETDTREVAENTAAGEDIGAPVAATDADNDALTYALGGTDAASFDINADTGQLMTEEALDYESKASYEVTVTATDGDNASDSIDVTITVTDVDEMEPQPGTVLERYDYNGDGMIEQAEVEDALNDYFFGQPRLSQEDVEDVLELYFFA